VKVEVHITCSSQIPRGEKFITCVNNNSYTTVLRVIVPTIQTDTVHLHNANSYITYQTIP
jgi:hypothetical protein